MQLPQVFGFNDQLVRTVQDEDGSIWFAAKDVAESIGIVWKGADTLVAIDAEWRGVRSFRTNGGPQDLSVIREPGVWMLVLRSNKPEAKAFARWIVAEVIPAIRKTGFYSTSGGQRAVTEDVLITKAQKYLADYLECGRLLGASPSLARAHGVIEVKRAFDVDLKPLLAENVTSIQERLVTPTELGALCNLNARQTNLELEKLGLQTRVARGTRKSWTLTEKGRAYGQLLDGRLQTLRWRPGAADQVLRRLD